MAVEPCRAGSATWSADPTSGIWNTMANWVPNTVPHSPSDIATFAASNITEVTTEAGIIDVDSVVLDANASPFQIVIGVGSVFKFNGTGVVNHSQAVQSFALEVTDETGSGLFFYGSATAGELTQFNNAGSYVFFEDESTAGKATFTTSEIGARQGNLIFFNDTTAAEATIATVGNSFTTFYDDSTADREVFTASEGGSVVFSTNSTAERASIECSGATEPGPRGGVNFDTSATAAQSHVVVDGAAVAGAAGNEIIISDSATGGSATFVVNGGAATGAEGATMNFHEESTAGAASITINPGTNGGAAGSLFFFERADGGTASIALLGGSQMDIGKRADPGVTIGSLAGDGPVFLGAKNLTIGSNNQSTAFSGVLQDGGINQGTGGSLSKIGSGLLTLSGANTYTGGTTVSAGALAVRNTTGSATGTGPVQVNGGTLAGAGSIAGAVTLGSGSGTGAVLSPGQGASKPTRLTLESSLTLKADATYRYRLNLKKAKSDLVTANGITSRAGRSSTSSRSAAAGCVRAKWLPCSTTPPRRRSPAPSPTCAKGRPWRRAATRCR
ncbi:MAG: autotransporter-associated beta strand repeat-containing protein [Verrucomicrobiota bacterium]|nr:autotransporter-associated beta strand repeat-containing protein [Verrucomicrobiota bacterium]